MSCRRSMILSLNNNPDSLNRHTSEQQSQLEPVRFEFADALRGIAVIGVVLVHTDQNFKSHYSIPFIQFGMYGVQLFYIISAFSLVLSFINRSGMEILPLRNYFIRRFFRIAPLFYMAILLYWSLDYILAEKSLLRDITQSKWPIEIWHAATAALFINGWHYQAINRIVPGGWSVAIETNFYVILPVMLIFATSLERALVLFVGTIILRKILSKILYWSVASKIPVADLLSFDIFAGMWLPNQLPVFALGIIMYWVLQKYPPIENHGPVSAIYKGYWMGLVISLLLSYVNHPLLEKIVSYHIQVSLVLLFFSLILASGGLSFLINRFTIFIGKISYSVYLLHMAVLHILLLVVDQFIEPYLGYKPDFLLALPTVMLLTCFVSHITYRYIEVPAQNIGRGWIRRLEARG
jgi:peptidoglycan/LPS O-acetylase OafA/YrhL